MYKVFKLAETHNNKKVGCSGC